MKLSNRVDLQLAQVWMYQKFFCDNLPIFNFKLKYTQMDRQWNFEAADNALFSESNYSLSLIMLYGESNECLLMLMLHLLVKEMKVVR